MVYVRVLKLVHEGFGLGLSQPAKLSDWMAYGTESGLSYVGAHLLHTPGRKRWDPERRRGVPCENKPWVDIQGT